MSNDSNRTPNAKPDSLSGFTFPSRGERPRGSRAAVPSESHDSDLGAVVETLDAESEVDESPAERESHLHAAAHARGLAALSIEGREKTPEEIARDNAAARARPIDDEPTVGFEPAQGAHVAHKSSVAKLAEIGLLMLRPAVAKAGSLPVVGSLLRHPMAHGVLQEMGLADPASAGSTASAAPSPSFDRARFVRDGARAPGEAPLHEKQQGVRALMQNPLASNPKMWAAGGAIVLLWWMFGGSTPAPRGPRYAPNSVSAPSANAQPNMSAPSDSSASGPKTMLTGDAPLPGFQPSAVIVNSQGTPAPTKVTASPAHVIAPATIPTVPATPAAPAAPVMPTPAATPAAPVAPAPAAVAPAPAPSAQSTPAFFQSMTLSGPQAQQAARAVVDPSPAAQPTPASPAPATAAPTTPIVAPAPSPAPVASTPAVAPTPAPAPAAVAPTPAPAPATATPAPNTTASHAVAKPAVHPVAREASAHPRVAAKPQSTGETQADRDAVRALNSELDRRLSAAQ